MNVWRTITRSWSRLEPVEQTAVGIGGLLGTALVVHAVASRNEPQQERALGALGQLLAGPPSNLPAPPPDAGFMPGWVRAWAIVPAHNEAPRIAPVLAALVRAGVFARVLCVDDGSTDGTAAVARSVAGVDVMELRPNRGKGQAMRAALEKCDAEVVAFFDADLVGLSPEHAKALVAPVARGEFGMVCGLRDYGPVRNHAQAAGTLLTGERAVRLSLALKVPAELWSGYKIEVALNDAVARAGSKIGTVILNGLQIVSRTDKLGLAKGSAALADMSKDIADAMQDIRANHVRTAPEPATLTAKCNTTECVMDAVAGAIVRQSAPLIKNDLLPSVLADKAALNAVGSAAGKAAAQTVTPYAAVAAGAVVLASTAVAGRALRWW